MASAQLDLGSFMLVLVRDWIDPVLAELKALLTVQ